MDPDPTSRLMRDAGFRAAYEILGELGRGSFGRVYRARQRSTGQDVAIKVVQVPDDAASQSESRHVLRFRQELRLCAELFHPNIVRLLDSGEAADGTLYAVFEHVPGTTLKDLIASEGKLEPREAAHLMSQVLDALSCAHACGIVHRDLTPANVMITKTGVRRNALVLDFGLGGLARAVLARSQARITATHEMLGTPCYAAPEQLRGEPPSPSSDIYSWGLVLLECLTGEQPMAGASAQEVIFNQLGPEPVAIPRWLRSHPLGQLVEEVSAKRADKRLTEITRVFDALGNFVSPEAPGKAADSIAGAAERGRRQLTVSCVRLSVRSAGERELDVEEVDQLLEARRMDLAARVSSAGGSVVALLADRIFLVHGYPQAREGDARRAARIAWEITRESLDAAAATGDDVRCAIHVGIHTGLVIVRDPGRFAGARPLELTGITPQIASRLADLAGEGEVLVSSDTHLVLRSDFESEPAAECALSELSRPMPTYRLTADSRRARDEAPRTRAVRTPLVGRGRELSVVLEGWQAAQSGAPGAVLITGEAGIGKSRLLSELRQRVGGESWSAWECTPEGQTAPLRPIIDALSALNEPVEALVARLGLSATDHLPWLARLMSASGPEGEAAPVDVSPERQKALTLDAILAVVLRMAEREPMVLAVENLHWADRTTLELLRLLAIEIGAHRIGPQAETPRLYLVATTRPELVPPWAAQTLSFLPLQRLSKADVAEMVRAALGDPGAPSPALVDAVMERAEGVPLFVEEVARLVRDAQRSAGSRSGGGSRLATSEVPTAVRDLLTARLDGVSAPARETAQLAAVLGRDFGYDLLRAVSPRDEGRLVGEVAELAEAGLVFPRRSATGQRYVFRHALLRDAAYDALTRPDRELLHRRVARVLRERFPETTRRRPEILALHHEQGGETATAVDCWLLAGQQTYGSAAYEEALDQLGRGLALVGDLSPSTESRQKEVALRVVYGTALLATRGWGDLEVEANFRAALHIAEEVGGDPPFMVLYGLWAVLITRSDRAGVDALLERLQALLERSDDRAVQHFCRSILGIAATWRGDFPTSNRLLEEALGVYDEKQFYAAYDGGLYTFAFQFCALWSLGFADRACALREEAFGLARRRRDPYSLGVVLAFGGVLANDCGDSDLAVAYGEELLALANEQRLYPFWAAGACGYGKGLVDKGRIDEGLRFIREGLERYHLMGMMGSYSDHQTYLAYALLAAGQLDEAMAAVDEGLALCETLYARFHEPELWRLRGDVLARRADPEAETSLRRALAIDDERGAVAYGLRAATSLARWLRDAGRSDEAATLLAPRLSAFDEGFGTRDLSIARALLDDLTSR